MKKFKTKRYFKKIFLILFIFMLFTIFILLSFLKLQKSYTSFIDIIMNDFQKIDKNKYFNLLTNNLDNLVDVYSFNKEEKIINSKIIYLYNTYNLKKYHDDTLVTDATNLLKNNLNKLGFRVIMEEKKASEYLHLGLSYYNISRMFLLDVMNKEKNILYYIDIDYDDNIDNSTITINNRKYAKIIFTLNTNNSNYEKNKIINNKMNDYLNENYPGVSRGIEETKDSINNQDLSDKVLLIKIGGKNNNIEEVNNSTEIISLMIYHIVGESNEGI